MLIIDDFKKYVLEFRLIIFEEKTLRFLMIDNDFCINHVNSDYAESTCFTNLIFFLFYYYFWAFDEQSFVLLKLQYSTYVTVNIE